jgi:TPR repeat protein
MVYRGGQTKQRLCPIFLGVIHREHQTEEAIRWFKKAAGNGDLRSQHELGVLWYTRADYAEAHRWFRKAAGQNYAPSQFALAYMYERSEGVPPNRDQAIALYSRAAAQGEELATEALRRLRISG